MDETEHKLPQINPHEHLGEILNYLDALVFAQSETIGALVEIVKANKLSGAEKAENFFQEVVQSHKSYADWSANLRKKLLAGGDKSDG
ncbi:hypothetical protein [Ferrovibrio sp.]|uniref:hypothetical protein n=1 Tax=Ferrovibrio sp. TaxID=1917215 RepID=UPI001B50002F|nr:hypothetical protein [Ferrovibrio sp.]MBP7066470.1 hypothetical protein [Ferrovibrio sp.]